MTELRSYSKKVSDNAKDFLKKRIDPYSYYYDKLTSYVSDRAKEKCIVLNHLNTSNWELSKELLELLNKETTDCVINGKKLIDCYKEIDELLEKYTNKSENADKSEDKETSEEVNECMSDQTNENQFSYIHDKLTEYVSIKVEEKHITLNDFKNICGFSKELEELLNRESINCVMHGKQLFDCYKDIDELLEKYMNKDDEDNKHYIMKLESPTVKENYTKILKAENIDKSGYKEACCKAYDRIASYLIDSSNKANISLFKVVDRLIKNYHSPTTMASLIAQGKISFDDITPYIDDTIAELSRIRRMDKDE